MSSSDWLVRAIQGDRPQVSPAADYGARTIDFSARHQSEAKRSQPIPLPLPVIEPRKLRGDGMPVRFAAGSIRPSDLPMPVQGHSRPAALQIPGAITPRPEDHDEALSAARRSTPSRRQRMAASGRTDRMSPDQIRRDLG
ncbi:hypothetical protein GCM10009127_13490 [Alteraurantiacibacter aestuarii]|uniref:Uncharacterized protein n=1 Tax=Alteraurantiacibacter aestuarii TaxID=650004 RepID=A0A844ZHT6_9SPHN|nr:hypothetical protein [Alteraurantiacibacter aestuarii]MXO88061.1 hypothetical protein [Alteraurantiacibacter aestuarii]